MVVLEEGSMLTTGPNQYLQPDYLSPLPTTLDAKKSPLALLAQTCSQIGADSPTKPLISTLDKPSKGSSAVSNARSPPAAKLERTRGSPSDGNASKSNSTTSSSSSSLAFKPYETNVVSKQRSEESRPASKASSVHSASGGLDNNSASASDEANNNNNNSSNNNNNNHKKSSHRATPIGRKSASPAQTSPCNSSSSSSSSSKSPSAEQQRKTPAQEREKSSASPKNSNSSSSSGASPIIRSGMEILSGHKDAAAAAAAASMYKPGMPFSAAASAAALCCPPGMAENPAFRPPFAGASPFSHHHAAALLGYPGANNPYLSYARVKTPSGGETLVPVCKDPFCTGCQYSVHNLMAAAAAAAPASACPSGCTQCDHQKYGLMGLSSLGPMPPPSLAGYPSSLPAAAAAAGKPHVCSWIAGDSYCGKRFATSEELLQHLRSHTSLGAEALHPLLSPRGYPAPSLSPLSARYHPYGKPPAGPLPASLAASPYSAFNALGPYYSPYAIYGQRLGAAVHP